MISLSIHEQNGGLEIDSEFPSNGQTLNLNCKATGMKLTLYLPVEQWYALRKILPKADGYVYFLDAKGDCERVGSNADLLARTHYCKYSGKS